MNPATSSMRPTTLVLIAASYPYDGAAEQTFLVPEMKYLTKDFNLILVPERRKGKRMAISEDVKVDETYALRYQGRLGKARILWRALSSRFLYQEVLARPSILTHVSALRSLVVFVGRALATRSWINRFLKTSELSPSHCIFYTYWLGACSLGIGLAKMDYPPIKLVSRAHGIDLYEERHDLCYIPCRHLSLEVLDRLFLASEDGRSYLSERYPLFASSYEVSKLGTLEPGFTTSSSKDGVFRIVTCSYIVPVKRIDLFVRGMAVASRWRPNQRFEWRHFGDGPLQHQIEELARKVLPKSVEYRFEGYLPLESIMRAYRESPVDLFVNVSESEGGNPVSIMEALSCGMPVLATAVGGNPEIVSGLNGLLLKPNPTPEEIARAVLDFLDNPELAVGKRQSSQITWRERFNADTNYPAFVTRLRAIRELP